MAARPCTRDRFGAKFGKIGYRFQVMGDSGTYNLSTITYVEERPLAICLRNFGFDVFFAFLHIGAGSKAEEQGVRKTDRGIGGQEQRVETGKAVVGK